MRHKRRFAAVVIAACVALPLAACGDDSGSKPSELTETSATSGSPSSASTSSAPPVVDDETAVIAAYKGFFETLLKLGEATDSTEVRQMLAPYGAGPAVERVVTLIESLRANNKTPGGAVVFSDVVVELNGDQATATECRDATTELIVDAGTNEPMSMGAASNAITATLTKSTVGWRVADYDAIEHGC